MDCTEIREFLIADFTDGEAGPLPSRELQGHLAACPACAAFSDDLQVSAIEPFRELGTVSPPDGVWGAIKAELHSSGAIREERSSPSTTEVRSRAGSPGFLSRLLSAVTIPRRAIATAAIAAILAGGFYILIPQEDGGAQGYVFLEDDVEFIYYLGSYNDTVSDAQFVKLGTNIEEYFL